MAYKILTINPGSTSTKIAVFEGEEQVFKKNLKHTTEEVSKYEHIADQKPFRTEAIKRELKWRLASSPRFGCLRSERTHDQRP